MWCDSSKISPGDNFHGPDNTESGHQAVKCEESETAAAHWPRDRNQCQTVTDVTPGATVDVQLEDTCGRGKCRGLERRGQRWQALDRCGSEGKEKTEMPGNVRPGQSQSDNKSLRRPYPRNPVFPRESLSATEAKYKMRVEQFLTFADQETLALVGDDEVDAAIVQQQSRPSCERWGSPHGRTPLLSTSVCDTGGTKARPILESSERVEEESSDKITTTTCKDDLVRCLLGNGKKQTADGHPRDDDDPNLLPPWTSTAAKTGGPDQTRALSGMRLVSAPPCRATRRAKQNSKLRRTA